MTDNEIVKALECCTKLTLENCKACPYYHLGHGCLKKCFLETIALINRQKAEIERLEADNKVLSNVIKNTFLEKAGCEINPLAEIKAEAVKEFADRLRGKLYCIPQHHFTLAEVEFYIDNLVKEFTE